MLGSILHRATGVANYVGAFAVTAWLFAAASGREAYETFEACASAWYGQLILLGFTLSVVYHLLNGIRHLFLDAGSGFSPKGASTTALIVLILAIVGTAAIWYFGGLFPGLVSAFSA